MDKALLRIMQHSLGLDQYGQGRQYRNHYVAGGDAAVQCRELVGMGYMKEHQASWISGDHPYFTVTDRGIEAVALFSPVPPPPPKLTRAQQRYQDYHRSESSDGFAWFLGIEVPRLEVDYCGWNGPGRKYRYQRITRHYWGQDVIEGEWKPTKKEAKASYKAALAARKERKAA